MPPIPAAAAGARSPKPTRPRGRAQPDPFAPSGAPSRSDNRHFKNVAREEEELLARTYEAGRKEGAKAKSGEAKPKGGSSKGGSGASGARRRPPGSASARTAVRQLQAPVRAQLTSGLRLLGLALAVSALYAVLANASAFAGVLGGVGKAFDWLGSTRGVPKRN